MLRAALRPLRIFIVTGTMLALASVVWGAASRPPATVRRASDKVATSSRKQTAKSPIAAKAAKRSPVNKVAVVAAPKAGEAGMRIFRDPETGEIGPPTAENLSRLAAESQAHPAVDVSNLPQRKLANGGYELLTGAFEDAFVVQIDKNGKRVVRCVTDPKTAHKQTPQAPAREDR